jgi:hypothetical protein
LEILGARQAAKTSLFRRGGFKFISHFRALRQAKCVANRLAAEFVIRSEIVCRDADKPGRCTSYHAIVLY